ncbi:MAG: DUF2281 domain-containing protein [Candidatus Omnitrophica bacterium]|nr:DUF2281 domain-containing protein [Candidatus Omnitrophota bacterium]
MIDGKMIEVQIGKLPGNLKEEVLDYAEFLLSKYKYQSRRVHKKFKFDWEGALTEIKGEFSSVELQHKASEWR